MKRAVCLLSVDDEGRILAVSRKNDPTKFGLPGGKVDPGETDIEALIREVREETGLEISPDFTRPVFERVCKGDVDYETVTYYTSTFSGSIHTDEPVVVAWVERQVLLDGPFGAYNEALFRAAGMIE